MLKFLRQEPFLLSGNTGLAHHSKLVPLFAAMLLVSGAFTLTYGQTQSAQTLAERSAIVVRGKVLKVNASDEPMVAPSPSTAVISVIQMYSGNEIAGDLHGRTATVILSRPGSVQIGEELLFFGNPRFMGRSVTIADEGEMPEKQVGPALLSTLEQGSQARKDAPIRDRIATARLVFRGTVESVNPLNPQGKAAEENQRPAMLPSEHDPEWQVANVRVSKPLRGGEAGQLVPILFPASTDIMWFNSPKLKVGQDAVFLAHTPGKQDVRLAQDRFVARLQEKQPVYFVAEPSDVLPPSDEEHLRALSATVKETKE